MPPAFFIFWPSFPYPLLWLRYIIYNIWFRCRESVEPYSETQVCVGIPHFGETNVARGVALWDAETGGLESASRTLRNAYPWRRGYFISYMYMFLNPKIKQNSFSVLIGRKPVWTEPNWELSHLTISHALTHWQVRWPCVHEGATGLKMAARLLSYRYNYWYP